MCIPLCISEYTTYLPRTNYRTLTNFTSTVYRWPEPSEAKGRKIRWNLSRSLEKTRGSDKSLCEVSWSSTERRRVNFLNSGWRNKEIWKLMNKKQNWLKFCDNYHININILIQISSFSLNLILTMLVRNYSINKKWFF